MTFDTQSDGSVHANGTNDTTVTNSSVFDDLLAAHFIVDGGSTFTSDELQNYGNLERICPMIRVSNE